MLPVAKSNRNERAGPVYAQACCHLNISAGRAAYVTRQLWGYTGRHVLTRANTLLLLVYS